MAETTKAIIINGKTLNLATDDADLLFKLAPEGKVITAEADAIKAMLETALSSNRFWGDTGRIEELKKALAIPVTDDTSYNRCYRNARLDLVDKAAEKSTISGDAVEMPNEEEIHTEALSRWRKNRESDAKKAENKAKKQAKNQPQALA